MIPHSKRRRIETADPSRGGTACLDGAVRTFREGTAGELMPRVKGDS